MNRFAGSAASIAALSLCIFLTACASLVSSSSEPPSGKNVIVPVSVEANDLQGETVNLTVGQVLNINTGDLATDSYSGAVADEAVAKFIEGNAAEGSMTNPGVEAEAVGTTSVTIVNAQGGIQPLTFTVTVTPGN